MFILDSIFSNLVEEVIMYMVNDTHCGILSMLQGKLSICSFQQIVLPSSVAVLECQIQGL